jgi:hypothetical protein
MGKPRPDGPAHYMMTRDLDHRWSLAQGIKLDLEIKQGLGRLG